MKLEFDPVADAAYREISGADVESSKEIQPVIIADYGNKGQIARIEILHISKCALPPLEQAA